MTHPFEHSQPIYAQIMDLFYERICRGELKPGDKLPSVRDAAGEVGVNPNTIQRSYMEMERRGIIESRRGQGTFVTTTSSVLVDLRKELANKRIRSFHESMRQLGYTAEEIVSMTLQMMQIEEKANLEPSDLPSSEL